MPNISGIIHNIMNSQKAMQNPMFQNAYKMLQRGDEKGLEQMARNICKEKNIDVDQAIESLKNSFR